MESGKQWLVSWIADRTAFFRPIRIGTSSANRLIHSQKMINIIKV